MRTVVVVAAAVALTACRPSGGAPAPDAACAAPSATPQARNEPARFSRPIAAAHAPSGQTWVAGLVAARGVVALTAIAPDGTTAWTQDVLPGVAWSANASLSVFPFKTGGVVVWRGLRSGQQATALVRVGADGKVDGEPLSAGAAACATEGEVAWIDHGTGTSWVVRSMAVGAASPSQVITLPDDRDPSILCTPHHLFALADGESDVLLSAPATSRSAPVRLIQDSDFGADDERTHELYSVGDTLGVVRIGDGGSVAAREVGGEKPSPWRRFGKKLGDKDDVTLVDADARMAVVVFSREAAASGEGAGPLSVEAFGWERGGKREVDYQVAPADGAVVRGPFWSGAVNGGVVVGWAERPSRVDAGGAPVAGLGYRLLGLDGPAELRKVVRPADDLVDAGCDDTRCYVVALARAPGEDGGQPEAVAVIGYP